MRSPRSSALNAWRSGAPASHAGSWKGTLLDGSVRQYISFSSLHGDLFESKSNAPTTLSVTYGALEAP